MLGEINEFLYAINFSYEYLVCMFLMFYLLYKNSIRKNKIKYYKLFNRIIIGSIFLITLETIKMHIINVESTFSVIIHLIYYALFTYTGFCFFRYFAKLIHYKLMTKIYNIVLYIFPLFVTIITLLLYGVQRAQLTFCLLFVIACIISSIDMIFYIKRINKCYIDRIKFITFPLIPLIVSIIHFYLLDYYYIPIYVGIISSLVVCYIASIELLISIDSLTNINNRNNLISYINNKIKHNSISDLHILMIDLDKFKKINDTYGHQVGDKCLLRVSDAIKHACALLPKRSFICRYGGDEFLVVANCTKDQLLELENNINTLLKKLTINDTCNNFTISIGTSDYIDGENICDFITRADNDLYEIKRNKK